MSKRGAIEWEIKVPVILDYEICPTDRETKYQVGLSHVSLEKVTYPTHQEMADRIAEDSDKINAAIRQEAGEGWRY